MNLATIRDEWYVPARNGARVIVQAFDRPGTITGMHNEYIGVQLDGTPAHIYVHPEDLTYLKGTP